MMKILFLTILFSLGVNQAQCTTHNQYKNNHTQVNIDNNHRLLFPSIKRIWIYWDKQIQKAPLLVQMCLQKMRMVSEEQNWQLILMTDDNLHLYIKNYESEFLQVKKRMKHPQWKAGVADLIRLYVLEQHGGIWFDISTILIHGLKWINNLENIPYLLANSQIDQGQQPDLLIPYLNYYQSLSEQRNSQGKLSKLLPGYEAWFIATGSPHLNVITQWKQYYIKHITQDASVNRKQEIQQQYYHQHLQGQYLNVDKSINEIIEDKQRQIDSQLGLFEKRKNANKELNIVGLHGEYGPFALYLNLIPQMDMAFTHSLDELQEQYMLTVSFFIKFTNKERNYFEDKINKLIEVFRNYHSFQNYIESKPPLEKCNDVVFIVEDSIFGRLIKNNKLAQYYKLNPISEQQSKQWRKYCEQYKREDKISKYPIVDNTSQIQYFWDWLYYFQLIDNEMRIQIIKYFQDVNWMGIISIDFKELYFWKKIYQQQNTSLLQPSTVVNDEKDKTVDQEVFQIVDSNTNNNHQENSIEQLKDNSNNMINNLQTEENSNNNQNYNNNNCLDDKIKNCKNKKWSQFTLKQKLHVFLQIFIAKIRPVAIKFWYLTNDMHPYLDQLIPLVLWGFLLFNLIIIPLRFRIRYLKYLVRICRYLVLRKQLDRDTSKHWLSIRKYLTQNRLKKILTLIWKLLLFITKLIVCFVIGIIFVAFQIGVILKYIRVCLDGDIYNQQGSLALIMVVQILFRQIIYKCLSVDSWMIPGVSLQFLYRLFLPMYYMSVGRCLITFGEKREQWNFGLGFTTCLIYPIVVKEIQHQARKVLEIKRGIVDNCSLMSRVTMKILKVLANITSVIERLILGGLVFSYFVPNILFVYYGDEHLIRSVIVKLAKAGPVLLGILLVFYLNELFHFGRQIYNQWKTIVLVKTPILKVNRISKETKQLKKSEMSSVKKKEKKQSNLKEQFLKGNEETKMYQLEQLQQYSQRKDHATEGALYFSSLQQLHQQQQYAIQQQYQQQQYETHCQCKPKLFQYSVITLVHLAKYSINTYLIMELCIDPYPDMVYKNVLEIWKPKVLQVLLLLIINYEVEKVIDQLCLQIQYLCNRQLMTKSVGKQQYQQKQQQKQDYFHNHNWYVSLIGLYVFQLLRLQMWQYIFTYFDVIDKLRFDLRWNIEKQFPLYKEEIIYYTFAGYWLMRIVQCFITENGNRIKGWFIKTVHPQELNNFTLLSNNKSKVKLTNSSILNSTQIAQQASSYAFNKENKNDL